MPQRRLGRTDKHVSLLGVGCAPFADLSTEQVSKIIHRALELDVNYFDVAPNYGNARRGYSEKVMGPTVAKVRDRMFLVSKTESETRDGTWRLLEQSLNRLKTDYLDLVHIHNFGHQRRFPDAKAALSDSGALGALKEARRQGVIRYIGASGHVYPSRFHEALDTGEIDVLMNAVNFVDQHTYDFESKVWSRARQEDLGLAAMKVLGGKGSNGNMTFPEEDYRKCIRYALSLDGLSTAVIGVKSISELEKAAKTLIHEKPLSPAEARSIARDGLELLKKKPGLRHAHGKPLT
jgi:aryl-alcohol dehydrogenase-like predicted oxidoreductase